MTSGEERIMEDTTERLGVISEVIQELDKRVIELQSRIRRLEATTFKQQIEIKSLNNIVSDLTHRLEQPEGTTPRLLAMDP